MEKEDRKTWKKKSVSVAQMYWQMHPYFSTRMLHDDKLEKKKKKQ